MQGAVREGWARPKGDAVDQVEAVELDGKPGLATPLALGPGGVHRPVRNLPEPGCTFNDTHSNVAVDVRVKGDLDPEHSAHVPVHGEPRQVAGAVQAHGSNPVRRPEPLPARPCLQGIAGAIDHEDRVSHRRDVRCPVRPASPVEQEHQTARGAVDGTAVVAEDLAAPGGGKPDRGARRILVDQSIAVVVATVGGVFVVPAIVVVVSPAVSRSPAIGIRLGLLGRSIAEEGLTLQPALHSEIVTLTAGEAAVFVKQAIPVVVDLGVQAVFTEQPVQVVVYGL